MHNTDLLQRTCKIIVIKVKNNLGNYKKHEGFLTIKYESIFQPSYIKCQEDSHSIKHKSNQSQLIKERT
jgi:hypothetical protein